MVAFVSWRGLDIAVTVDSCTQDATSKQAYVFLSRCSSMSDDNFFSLLETATCILGFCKISSVQHSIGVKALLALNAIFVRLTLR